MSTVIIGCGDIGRRIAQYLIEQSTRVSEITAYSRTESSVQLAARMGLRAQQLDLDQTLCTMADCDGANLFYTVAPQKESDDDKRSRNLLAQFERDNTRPAKAVVISTTGVYGDAAGDWVDESTPVNTTTSRSKRRLDLEQQWQAWGKRHSIPVVILRVPGIYAFSRLPRERLLERTPVVRASECGYSNRIHADDLALVCVAALARGRGGEIYNASDGQPGTITEYLQLAAQTLELPPLPEISMREAQSQLSEGMLSYLNESRKISNRKMLQELQVSLRYPNVADGIKH